MNTIYAVLFAIHAGIRAGTHGVGDWDAVARKGVDE